MPRLYADITGVTQPLAVTVSDAHNASMATASITASATTLDIGDEIDIDLGYSDDHDRIFTGYVKMIERKVPDNVYTITAYDYMSRAIDFFIASSNPDSADTYENINAEDLVRALLRKAGLAGSGKWDDDSTSFILGVNGDFEINLVGVYDYCKMVADALTWALWADKDGVIHFKNRKPYLMEGGNPGQPHWTADTPVNDGDGFDNFLDVTYRVNEKELRNKVVVYGDGVNATAEEESPFLPSGFRKTVVAAVPFIDQQTDADKTAEYNLNLLDRLTKELIIQLVGDHSLSARNAYQITERVYDYTVNGGTYNAEKNWYCFACDHAWGKSGYTTTLSLRRGITA